MQRSCFQDFAEYALNTKDLQKKGGCNPFKRNILQVNHLISIIYGTTKPQVIYYEYFKIRARKTECRSCSELDPNSLPCSPPLHLFERCQSTRYLPVLIFRHPCHVVVSENVLLQAFADCTIRLLGEPREQLRIRLVCQWIIPRLRSSACVEINIGQSNRIVYTLFECLVQRVAKHIDSMIHALQIPFLCLVVRNFDCQI